MLVSQDDASERHRRSPRAQHAFKISMVHGVLQFTLRIAVCCVLHRCESRDIRCWELIMIRFFLFCFFLFYKKIKRKDFIILFLFFLYFVFFCPSSWREREREKREEKRLKIFPLTLFLLSTTINLTFLIFRKKKFRIR